MSSKRILLRETRHSMGLTQKQLARLVGIDRAYLANIENGKYSPSLKVARRIANILDKNIEELFF